MSVVCDPEVSVPIPVTNEIEDHTAFIMISGLIQISDEFSSEDDDGSCGGGGMVNSSSSIAGVIVEESVKLVKLQEKPNKGWMRGSVPNGDHKTREASRDGRV
ncbi:hypothetical protein HAX54_013833 [Datura stramonium]|uniref:Uncharacterized protein n=1 Tax=Datura stramonium TaxID=4076 RepID=A0ABS8TPM4_DATST|nr:hypothetical protein [Datura stramonium]